MYFVGQLIGALLATFLLSRLLLWITRLWNGGIIRLALVHIFSWLLISIIAGVGSRDGGAFDWPARGAYAAAQTVWLFFDGVWTRIPMSPAMRKNLSRCGVAIVVVLVLVSVWMMRR